MSIQNFRTLDLAKEFYRDCEKLRCPAHVRDQLNRARKYTLVPRSPSAQAP